MRFILHSQIFGVTAFAKGGSPPKAPPPPPPPSPSTAAENYQKSDIAARTRRARGFGASIIGGYAAGPDDRPSASLLSKILGGQ